MAYVNVPKDILKIREKYFFGFAKREIISIVVSFGIISATYSLLKNYIGTNALYVGATISIPIFLFGFYEDDGVFIENKIKNYLYFLKNNKPKVYKTENFYNKILINKEIKKIIKDRIVK